MDKFCEDCVHNSVCQYGAIPPHKDRCNDKDTYESIDEFLNGKKEGEWSDLSTDGRHTGWIACSVCGQEPPNESNLRTNFCPNCGADMRKGGAE